MLVQRLNSGWRDMGVGMYDFAWFLGIKKKNWRFFGVNVKSKLRRTILYSLGWKVCFEHDTKRRKDNFDHYDETLVNPDKREITGKTLEHIRKRVSTKTQINNQNTLMEKLAKGYMRITKKKKCRSVRLLYYFPMAAVNKLPQTWCVNNTNLLLQFWRSEVRNSFHWIKTNLFGRF